MTNPYSSPPPSERSSPPFTKDWTPDVGSLPRWGTAEIPEPAPFSFRNAIRIIGPGAILLAGSIGGGEWLVGPSAAVQYGPGIFWIVTLAILFQLVFNLEAIRYTLYTGEPITTGFLRLAPGSKFWGPLYILMAIAQLGVPSLAGMCATVIFAGFAGKMPMDGDGGTILYITYGMIALVVLILLFGGTIERMLEYASWAMIVFILIFLLVVNIAFVSFDTWLETLQGFLRFGFLPEKANAPLLATLAATAGSGGIGNLVITNWIRDKGFGMGKVVGAIPSAVGSRHIQLAQVGKIFPINAENLRRFRGWWNYVLADQILVWCLGCFVGMFLNVNLARAVMPEGQNITDIAAGAYQAHYLAEKMWSGFWFLALMNGFWILFSTHLGNTDVLVRCVTDIVWVSSERARRWRGGRVALIYYAILLACAAWGLVAVGWGKPMDLFKVLGVIAGAILSLASFQVLVVNTKLLPPELRPPTWRRAALVLCGLFYGAFTVFAVWGKLRG